MDVGKQFQNIMGKELLRDISGRLSKIENAYDSSFGDLGDEAQYEKSAPPEAAQRAINGLMFHHMTFHGLHESGNYEGALHSVGQAYKSVKDTLKTHLANSKDPIAARGFIYAAEPHLKEIGKLGIQYAKLMGIQR